MTIAPFHGWPRSALDFFDGLEHHNSKEWFHANKSTYDRDVRGPMESLLAELADELGDGVVSRPNRDTRFSADKTPYKTTVYGRIDRPRGGGYYVRLHRDGLFIGGGLYAPDRETLGRMRAAIAADRSGAELESIVAELVGGGARLLTDGALKTAPRGYPIDHPRIELLRLPHLAGGIEHPVRPWLHTAVAKDRIIGGWHAVQPLLDWVERWM